MLLQQVYILRKNDTVNFVFDNITTNRNLQCFNVTHKISISNTIVLDNDDLDEYAVSHDSTFVI